MRPRKKHLNHKKNPPLPLCGALFLLLHFRFPLHSSSPIHPSLFFFFFPSYFFTRFTIPTHPAPLSHLSVPLKVVFIAPALPAQTTQ
jgi:hypothetical protein